jgi:hypothetical protein
MRIGDKEITTVELERMFYTGNPDDLKLVVEALSDEFKQIESGDDSLISYVTDNLEQAKRVLNERAGALGYVGRALEIADAALDYYENQYFEILRQEDEKRVTEANKKDVDEVAKKLTDTVLKAKAAVKVAPYRRIRNYIRGYYTPAEKACASLRCTIESLNGEAYRQQRMSYRPPEQAQP